MFSLFRRKSLFGQEHNQSRPRRPLAVEALEDRTVPATFNIADGDVAGLIAAVNTANTNDEADDINLAAGGTFDLTSQQSAFKGGSGLPDILLDNGNLANTLTVNGNGSTIQ